MSRFLEGRRRRAVAALALWAALSALSVRLQSEPEGGGIDIDETYWIGSAYYYHLAFERRDWRHPDWGLLPARENPPLAKYVIGAWLALSGRHVDSVDTLASFYATFEPIPGAWGGGHDRARRAEVVARADPELRRKLRSRQLELDPATLRQARRAMVGCALLTSLMLLLFGAAVYGWAAGLLASQLLLLHPVVGYAYGHAMADAPALLFSTAAALTGPLLLRLYARAGSVRAGPAVLGAVAGGTLLGLACGAKLNALVVAAPLAACVLAAANRAGLRGDRRGAGRIVASGLGIAVWGLVVFVAVNPAILQDPVAGLAATVREHRTNEAVQAAFISGHLTTAAEKLTAVADLACLGWPGCVLLATLATAALFSRRDETRFAAVWWVSAFAAVAVWIPFAWPRYALPVVVPSVLLLAWLLDEAFARARAISPGRASPTPPVSAA